MKKYTYTYCEIKATDRYHLCAQINRRILRGERVFQIDYLTSQRGKFWYGVTFEKAPELPVAKLRAFRIKTARAART